MRTGTFRRIIEASQSPPDCFRQLAENCPCQLLVAVTAVIHERAHLVAHRHRMVERGFAKLRAAGTMPRPRCLIFAQRRVVRRCQTGFGRAATANLQPLIRQDEVLSHRRKIYKCVGSQIYVASLAGQGGTSGVGATCMLVSRNGVPA